MAEGVGFEPTAPLRAQRFSRASSSTAPAPFPNRGNYILSLLLLLYGARTNQLFTGRWGCRLAL